MPGRLRPEEAAGQEGYEELSRSHAVVSVGTDPHGNRCPASICTGAWHLGEALAGEGDLSGQQETATGALGADNARRAKVREEEQPNSRRRGEAGGESGPCSEGKAVM